MKPINFHVGQNIVKVDGSDQTIEMLYEHLKIKEKNSYFKRKKIWIWDPVEKRKVLRFFGDGKTKFFDKKKKVFAYGLWPQVYRYCKDNHIKLRHDSARKPLEELKIDKLGDITLNDLQMKAINRWFDRGGSGIVWAAPGFGKTEVAAAIAKEMLRRGLTSRVLFVVNGLDLLEQARERLNLRLGKKIGVIGSGQMDPEIVTVGSITQLHRSITSKNEQLLSYLEKVDFVIYDEVHHSRSIQTRALFSKTPAKYRLGMSARPFHKYDTRDLNKMTAEDVRVLASIGPVVARVPASLLIKRGLLAAPRIYLYPIGWDGGQLSLFENLEWKEARKQLIVKNSIVRKVTRRCVLEAAKAGETTLVIAGGSKKLGLSLHQELQDHHLNSVYLHGSIKKDFRNESRKKMTNKRLEVCVATTIYDEGIDIPSLRQLILPYGGLSAIKNDQRLGRSLRSKTGKNVVIVVDFLRYNNKHLRKHSYARLNMYLEEEMYDIYLVTDQHPNRVINLVGRDKIVDELPNKKTFMELKREERKLEDGKGIQRVA